MPAQSQQQQKLFGLALSVKRGETPRSEASKEVLDIVDSMSEKQIKDFAGTSHSGLPKKVESALRELVRDAIKNNSAFDVVNEHKDCGCGCNGTTVGGCNPSLNESQLKGLEGIPSTKKLKDLTDEQKLKIIQSPGNVIDFKVPDYLKGKRNHYQVISKGKIIKKKNISGDTIFFVAGGGLMNSPTYSSVKELINNVLWDSMEDARKFNEQSINEAYVPSNIKEFAKRKGVTQLVNTVAGWAEKVGKKISGGTAVGRNYDTLVLDMGYNDSAIRINCETERVELYDELVRNFQQFKKVYNEYQMDESVKIKMNALDWGKSTAERNSNLDKYDSLKTDKERENFLRKLKGESVNEDFKSVVGKTVFSDGKGKLHFGYYKEDDSAYFVDYKTWAKLGMKDVSKGDTNKDKVVNSILRNQKQFNKKVDYNMWAKKTNPSFEQKMDWFIKNGWISNITKAGIKEGVELVNESSVEIGDTVFLKSANKIATVIDRMGRSVTVKTGDGKKIKTVINNIKTLVEDNVNEVAVNPVKKVMNTIFKKNGISNVKSNSTDVRGFSRTSGSGYKYEYNGLVTFHKISPDVIKDLAKQMREAGIEIDLVGHSSIEFNHRKLKTEGKHQSVNEASNEIYFKTATEAVAYARTQTEKRGFEIDEDDWHTQITMGGKYSRTRPGVGKTHSFSVGLLKGGKPQRKNLNISLYGMESGKFELTFYIN